MTNHPVDRGTDDESDLDPTEPNPTDPRAAEPEPFGQEPLDLESPVKARSPRGTSATLFGEAIVRAGLALLLLAIFAVTVFVALHGAGHKQWPQFKDALAVLLPAETGLLGSAVGYYYGTRKNGPGE